MENKNIDPLTLVSIDDFEKKYEKIKINVLENINNILDYSLEKEIKENKKENKILNTFSFLLRYIITSSFIFLIILLITNYKAYIEIAKSYLNPNTLTQKKENMLSSIQQSSIKKDDNEKEEYEDKKNLEENEKKSMLQKNINFKDVKNKTFHSMKKLINTTNRDNNIKNYNIELTPYENRIVIPKIGKNIPLVEVDWRKVKNMKELENVFQEELVNWIIRYPWSARPWEKWNSFIFGHSSNFPWLEWNYNDVFALMDHIVFWDEVIAYYWQKKYVYKIKEKKVIKPWDTSILKRDKNKKEITLMTCWPVWTTLNRMIVIWELVENNYLNK